MKFKLYFSFFLFGIFAPVFAQNYSVGVYYFPGWKDHAEAMRDRPWEKIKAYPDREPKLGWYPEGDMDVTEQHLKWMHDYGIDFVVYDWYWTVKNAPRLNHAIESYLSSSGKRLTHFSIMWANHTDVPQNLEQFDSMVDFWIANYLKQPEYVYRDGMPMVVIFSPSRLEKNAKLFGESGKSLLARARAAAVKAGLKGIYFVGSAQALPWEVVGLKDDGYSALTAYNYPYGLSGKAEKRKPTTSYTELTDGYLESWKWILNNSSIPYFVPVISGWDASPWSDGKFDPRNLSFGSPDGFKRHLIEAKGVMDAKPLQTSKTVMICCWNEFGEGSYIEPTKKDGFLYLDAIRQTFKK